MSVMAPTTLIEVFDRAVDILRGHGSVGRRHPLRALLGLLLRRDQIPRLGEVEAAGNQDLVQAVRGAFAKAPPFDDGNGEGAYLALFGDVVAPGDGENDLRNAFASQKGIGCFGTEDELRDQAFRHANRDDCPHRQWRDNDYRCGLSPDQATTCKSQSQRAGEVPKLLQQLQDPNHANRYRYRLLVPDGGDLEKFLNDPQVRLPLWPTITAIYSGSPHLHRGRAAISDSSFYRDLGLDPVDAEVLFTDAVDHPENRAIIGMTEPALLQVLRYRLYAERQFMVSLPDLINYYLSLKPRAFVILAGVSGTGKSRLPRLFSEFTRPEGTEPNSNFEAIPVRPGWNDTTDLMGFYNSLHERFERGPALEAFEKAGRRTNVATTLLLDEMNLSRVEHYFADFLSVMEARTRREDGRWETDPFRLPLGPTQWDLPFPDNLFIVGTVNIDESTHGISKKVLDRANTIEFENVYFAPAVPEEPDYDGADLALLGRYLVERPYRTFQDALAGRPVTVRRVVARLRSLYQRLLPVRAQFGNRTIEDVAIYMASAVDLIDTARAAEIDLEGFTRSYAFDRQIEQKILPRLMGTREEIQRRYTAAGGDGDFFQQLIDLLKSWSCPRSVRKLESMRVQEIVNYWEA